MQVFKLPAFEKIVQAITKKLPAHQEKKRNKDKKVMLVAKDVRGFTKRLLVAGVAKSNDVGDAKRKSFKSCKMKHLKGKHIAEGKKRYQEYLSHKKDGGRRKTTTWSNETAAIEVVGDARKQRKFSVRSKMHFPHCKSQRGLCDVCNKRHQPYCKRVKTESSHPVSDTTEIKQKLQGLSFRKN